MQAQGRLLFRLIVQGRLHHITPVVRINDTGEALDYQHCAVLLAKMEWSRTITEVYGCIADKQASQRYKD